MGIIIPAATSLESPEAKNQVEWEKESTKDKTGAAYSGKNTFKSGEGEFMVVHQGDSFSKAHSYLLLTDVPGASANSGATITSKDSNGKQAFLATETRGTTEQEVAVGAGSELRTIVDNGGKSEFSQLVEASRTRTLWGRIELSGSGAKKLQGSGGYTLKRIAAGQLELTLSEELSEVPVVQVTAERFGEFRVGQLVSAGKKTILANGSTTTGTGDCVLHVTIIGRP